MAASEPKNEVDDSHSKSQKLSKKQEEVDKLFCPDQQGKSPWVSREEIDKNPILIMSKNGNSRHGIFFGDNRYLWEKEQSKKKGRFVSKIRTNGINKDELVGANRPIQKMIRQHYNKTSCVSCGSHSSLIVDHKNDLYNDKRVLIEKTQKLEDFQCLCQHCNLQKRNVCKKEKEDRKIYSAKNIKRYKILPFEIPWEKKIFDESDITCKIDTYWYDPVVFEQKIIDYATITYPIVKEMKVKIDRIH